MRSRPGAGSWRTPAERPVSAGVLAQLEDLPRLVRRGRLAAPLARDARHAADELGVLLGELALVVEDVVLEAEAHVATQRQSRHGHRHRPLAHAGAGPGGAFGHAIDELSLIHI